MESFRRLTSFFDSDSRLGRRGSIDNGLLSPKSEAATVAAQRIAPSGLGITFITERLVAMGYPIQGPTDIKRNQTNIDDLAEYLENYHSNQYLIFNLNSLEDGAMSSSQVQGQDLESFVSSAASPFKSSRTATAGHFTTEERHQAGASIADKVRSQMVEFAWERDGMKAHTPPFDLIFRICYAIFAWLSLDASNIALINCQTGKIRSGIVVACYLLYARLADEPIEAFVEFYRKRWENMKSLTPDALRKNTPPSIHRFLMSFHDLVENQRAPNERPLLLKGIILRAVPVEFPPCVQIWDDYRQMYCTADGNEQGTENPVVDWDCEDGCLAILWENGIDVDGGFSILCSFGDEHNDDDTSHGDAPPEVLFRYAESTWFLAPGLITLTKGKLDMMKKYEEAFSDEHFSMDLVFVESKKTRRKYTPIDYTGNAAVKQGVIEITKHHLVLPDPGMHSNFIKMGFSDAATTFSLQRSQNAPNIALDLLHSSVLGACFAQVKRENASPQRQRPSLPSYSSSSLLTRDTKLTNVANATIPASPLVKRQSTAEINALQTQRSSYSLQAAVTVSSLCHVCNDDDYMKRPQIVRCTGSCGSFYHTTCVGLKRIPFGLTTLSDRTNHGVYVKKYFSAWECDTCSTQRSSVQQQQPQQQPAVEQAAPSRGLGVSFPASSQPTAPLSTHSTMGSQLSVAAVINNPGGVGDVDKMDQLKAFLAMSGVSVDDLLRAATTANVTISPSADGVRLPTVLSASSPSAADTIENTSATNSTSEQGFATGAVGESANNALSKLFANRAPVVGSHSNPQEDSVALAKCTASAESHNGVASVASVPAPSAVALSGLTDLSGASSTTNAKVSAQAALLAQLQARGSSASQAPVTAQEHASPPKVKTATPAMIIDPKSAMLAQIAARRQKTSDDASESEKKPTVGAGKANSTPADSLTKYQRMLQRGVPFEAVQNCMKKDGVEPGTLQPMSPQPPLQPTSVQEGLANTGTKLKDMEEFRGYFTMMRLGCPQEAVRQKMLMDGADPVVLTLGADALFETVKNQIKLTTASTTTLQDDIKSVKSHAKLPMPPQVVSDTVMPPFEAPSNPVVTLEPEVLLKDHEIYAKYFKMLKMRLPEEAVRHKMQQDGVDLHALELGGDAPFSKLSVKPIELMLRDDPVYSKYFKMLKMGLPADAVRHKMVSEQADPRALDLGGDAFVSQLTAASSKNGDQDKKKLLTPPTKVKNRRKKLHWQPIAEHRLTNTNGQTIWEDKDDDTMDFDMDMAELESLFFASSNDTSSAKKKKTTQTKELKRKQSVTLIDGKRAMNAAISLARIKLSYMEIAQAIQTFNAGGLTVGQLRGIRDCLPTSEEVVAVTKYTGEVAMLGEAEKFILEVCKVKRFAMRTDCLLFTISFAARREELGVSLAHVIDACQQVKDSRLLKILLSMVLKLGNTLNGSGEDNGIRGFTVDSLLRLGHTKAVNQKTTVLHYLVRLVKKNHPAVLDFQNELKNVSLAARESLETVDEDFGKLQTGLTQLSEEFQDLQKTQQHEADEETTHKTVAALQEAVENIGSQMETLDQTIKRARDQVQSVLEYFGEDPKKNSTEFFTTLSSFCSLFGAARKEVDSADEVAMRAERVKMRRNASMRPTPSNSGGSTAAASLVHRDRDRAMSDRALPRIIERSNGI